MGGIGPEKIILLLVVATLLFGAKRIPELGGSIGKGIREFKKSISGTDEDPDPRVARADEARPLRPAAEPDGARAREMQRLADTAPGAEPAGPKRLLGE